MLKKKDIDREYRKFLENWLPKYCERLQLTQLNIKDKRDIREEDWEVLRVAHRSYYMGYLPDFIPKWQPPHLKPKQATIFDPAMPDSAKLSENPKENNLGIDFVTELPEPTIVIENGKDKKVP